MGFFFSFRSHSDRGEKMTSWLTQGRNPSALCKALLWKGVWMRVELLYNRRVANQQCTTLGSTLNQNSQFPTCIMWLQAWFGDGNCPGTWSPEKGLREGKCDPADPCRAALQVSVPALIQAWKNRLGIGIDQRQQQFPGQPVNAGEGCGCVQFL